MSINYFTKSKNYNNIYKYLKTSYQITLNIMQQIDEYDEPIVVHDHIILAFYKQNTNLDFITMNRIFIDILNKLSTNLNETINNTINQKILTSLNDISKEIITFKQDVTSKLYDTKKEYIDNLKLILENNTLSNHNNIQTILDKNNETLFNKTTNIIINDIIPKHNNISIYL